MIMQILLTDGSTMTVNGHNLVEFKKYNIKVFYYKNDDNLFVLTEKSSGISIEKALTLKEAKLQLHQKYLNVEDYEGKMKRFLKKHFVGKYMHRHRIKKLNNTAGGMFKESKV